MKQNHFRLFLIIGLIVLSIVLFLIQFFAFRDLRDTFFYMFQDLAFLPVQVLLVTLVLDRILGYREKHERLNKQNMVIGTFFSQTGTSLLKLFSGWDALLKTEGRALVIKKTESDMEFKAVATHFAN